MQQLHGRKVIVLPRGGFMRASEKGKGIFHRNNLVSGGKMN